MVLPWQFYYAYMGVHSFPSAVELLVSGRSDSVIVKIVPGGDDKVASVQEAKFSHCCSNLWKLKNCEIMSKSVRQPPPGVGLQSPSRQWQRNGCLLVRLFSPFTCCKEMCESHRDQTQNLYWDQIDEGNNKDWKATWLFLQLPTSSGPYREVEPARNGEMVKKRNVSACIVLEN